MLPPNSFARQPCISNGLEVKMEQEDPVTTSLKQIEAELEADGTENDERVKNTHVTRVSRHVLPENSLRKRAKFSEPITSPRPPSQSTSHSLRFPLLLALVYTPINTITEDTMTPNLEPYVRPGDELSEFLRRFWQRQVATAERETPDFRHPALPLARIKKVMKSDPEVKVVSQKSYLCPVFGPADARSPS